MRALRAKYDQALTAVQQPDPATKALTDQAMSANSWLQAGDYRSAPKGVFFNLVDPALRQQQRQMSMNAGSQGIAALGSDQSTLLKMNQQNIADEFDRDTAANYQAQVSGLADKTAATLGGLGSAETNKRLSVLSNLGGMYNQASQDYQRQAFKPGLFQSLLPGMMQAGTSLALKFA